MNKNEIKKALYKQKPEAEYGYTRDNVRNYSAVVVIENQEEVVEFEVPLDDGGDTMEDKIPAQLLIRWLKL